MKRLTVTLAAIMLHLAIGSVYAWSVLVYPIMSSTGWSHMSVSLVFSVAISTLGLSAAFLGPLIKKVSTYKAILCVIICFIVGMKLSALAINEQIFSLLIIGYGILIGIATGIAYLLPIPILMTWYPHNKGTATGLVIMGFGLSSMFVSKLYIILLNSFSVADTLTIAGPILMSLTIPALFLLRNKEHHENDETKRDILGIEEQVIDAVKTDTFKVLWVIFFINIFVGIAAISSLAPMSIELFDLSAEDAALFVGIAGIVNGVSRILWAWISDMITRPLTFVILIACQMVSLIAMIYWYDLAIFEACIIAIISGYGGMFAVMPAYLADIFGTEQLTSNLGKMLTAWSIRTCHIFS